MLGGRKQNLQVKVLLQCFLGLSSSVIDCDVGCIHRTRRMFSGTEMKIIILSLKNTLKNNNKKRVLFLDRIIGKIRTYKDRYKCVV